MPPQRQNAPDDEPTEVAPAAGTPPTEGAVASDAGDDGPLWPDPPRVEQVTPSTVKVDAGGGTAPGEPDPDDESATSGEPSHVDEPTAPGERGRDDEPTAASEAKLGDESVTSGEPDASEPSAGASSPRATRGRRAADRTTEGAKAAADRVSQAAAATAQALRDTDVNELARHTTRLIENTRPFFLAAFAVAFSFLAAVENHASIGVVFAISAVICVLGAAFSPALDRLLKRSDHDQR